MIAVNNITIVTLSTPRVKWCVKSAQMQEKIHQTTKIQISCIIVDYNGKEDPLELK